MTDPTRLVSLAYAHRMTPISDWDEVLELAREAGIDPDEQCWALARVPVADMFTVEVEDDEDRLAALGQPVTDGDIPPLVLVHSPNHWGSGQDHLLWDGAHRRTVALRQGIQDQVAWVGHHGGCCDLATGDTD